jgi:predicted AAA+ superfamily ATPase
MEIKVYPLSYKELLEHEKQTVSQEILENKNLMESYEEQILQNYIKYGGMPFLQKLDDEDKYTYLNDLFDSIIFKDLITRYNIREVDFFRRLINYLMENVGNLSTSNNISKYLKNENIHISSNSIRNYITYLENVYLVKCVSRENIKSKEILKYNDKCYFIDHGFIQSYYNPENKNRGKIIENIVFNELLRRDYQVTIGKLNDKEIDFIAKKHDEKIYIQVTEELSSEDTINREFGNLEKIHDNYPKYVISTDKYATSQNGIKHTYLKDFLKEDRMIN